MKAFRLITPLNLDLSKLLGLHEIYFKKMCVSILRFITHTFQKLGIGAYFMLSMPTQLCENGH